MKELLERLSPVATRIGLNVWEEVPGVSWAVCQVAEDGLTRTGDITPYKLGTRGSGFMCSLLDALEASGWNWCLTKEPGESGYDFLTFRLADPDHPCDDHGDTRFEAVLRTTVKVCEALI